MAESSADSFILENWEWLTDCWDDVQPGGLERVAYICQNDLLLALDVAESLDLSVSESGVASQEESEFFRGWPRRSDLHWTAVSDDNYLNRRPESPRESA